ncbi:hypothetical protein L1987_14456 [Smallanthus sonchifolius]|uniref:Uncharacterized protein n=1 Tax=Smallanthus sonchifolius TaxID=185202 RepID=A0ACB9J513_9ASTR|nr:hypothetical protein L1987_14456 [Smallanthus sonchifolius]
MHQRKRKAVDLGYDLNLATSSGGETAEKGGDGPQRRLWVKNRSKDWWDKYSSADCSDDEFRKAFQMGKETFETICNELTASVAKENTMLRDAVPKRTEMKLQDLPVVLGACCVLHNICELRDEPVEPDSVIEVVDDEMVVPEVALRSETAMKARDAMAHNLLHHNHAGTSFL